MAKTAVLSVRIVSEAAGNGFKKAADDVGHFGAEFTKITAISTSVASGLAIAGGAIGQVAAGATALAAVAGPALGAVMLGVDGIKEAAQGLSEPFDQLKEAVSGEFASALEGPFERLGGLMGELQEPLAGLGGAVGTLMGGMVETIADNQGELEKLIAASGQFTEALGPGMNTLLEGVLSIGTGLDGVAGTFGEAFGGVLATLGEKFTEYASTGATTVLIEGMSQALQGLSNLIGPLLDLVVELGIALGPSFGGIFSALGVAVEGLIGPFSTIAQVAGQALVEALNILAPMFGPVAQAIADLVVAVAPLLGPLAEVVALIGTALAEAVSVVAPLVGDIAGLIGDVLRMAIEAVTPIIPTIIEAIGILADTGRMLIPVIGEIAQFLFPALGQILEAVAPLLPELAKLFMQLVEACLPLIPPIMKVAEALLPALIRIIQAILPILLQIAQYFIKLVEAVTPLLPPLADLIVDLLPPIVELFEAMAPATSALIGIIAKLAIGLAKGLVDAVLKVSKHLGWLKDLFVGLIEKIKSAFEWITDFLNAAGGLGGIGGGDGGGGFFAAGGGGGVVMASINAATGGFSAAGTLRLPNLQPGGTTQVTFHITINGPIDSVETGREIRRILDEYDAKMRR